MENMPKGIGFYNTKTGETRFAQLEAQIQGYINSSELGINASRDQDFGWKLTVEWAKMVKEFRKNETKMALLTERNGGQSPTTTQVLYAIYGEQIRAAQERADEYDEPFLEDYQKALRGESEAEDVNSSEPTDSTPSATESVQEVDAASESDKSADSSKKPSKK